ncbi:hypothetical protein [Niabella aurantiaca]|uniref:hypothetical protein n=1 Tax=Niabella aurantiaca TaxID=379900 RepID=UPI0012FC291B|nr:hypothetical protein [Niabella aurantiaca]
MDPIKGPLSTYAQMLSNYREQVANKFSIPALFEYNEVLGHFNTYEFLLKNLQFSLSEELLIKVHTIGPD